MLLAQDDREMTDPQQHILQQKIDCFFAKNLHVQRQTKANYYSQLVDLFAGIVPLLYFPVRYIGKGTSVGPAIEHVWEFLAAILIAATVAKFILRWPDKAQESSKMIGEEFAVIRQADRILSSGTITESEIHALDDMANKLREQDTRILGQPRTKDSQQAYRNALMESNPSNTNIVCPHCKMSPHHFTPGSCTHCGNTPKH